MKIKSTALFVLLAAALFWASWRAQLSITGAGCAAGRAAAEAHDRMPPLIALTTIALGGFRGLAVDLLWMRLIDLQKEGKVFEIVQLADWITKLEPQFTYVWVFHAWNMAYNISILYPAPEHRWLWVKNGIQLLRDSAIVHNPRDPVLYRELGWIFQHKIGQRMDDMHMFYRRQLAREIETSLATSADGTAQARQAGFKLDPALKAEIETRYGVLDWRLPEAHAIYWAWRGLACAGNGPEAENCSRMIAQCMAELFRQGRLAFDEQAGLYIVTPRLDLLPGALKAFEEADAASDDPSLTMARMVFMAEAAFILHVYGRTAEAKDLIGMIAPLAPEPQAGKHFESFLERCDNFKIAELPPATATAWIEGLLYQDYTVAQPAAGDTAGKGRQRALALWRAYNSDQLNLAAVRAIPDFALLDEQARRRALENPPGPGYDGFRHPSYPP